MLSSALFLAAIFALTFSTRPNPNQPNQINPQSQNLLSQQKWQQQWQQYQKCLLQQQQQTTGRNQPKNTKNQNFIPCYPPQPIYPNQLMDQTQYNNQYPQQFNNNQNLPSGSTGPNGKRIPQQPQKGQKPIIPQINQFPGQSMNQLKQQPLPPQNILKNEIPVDICTSFTHCNTGMKCCAMQKSNLLGLSYQRFNLPVLGRCTKACQIGEINL